MGDNVPQVEGDSWCRTTSGDKASTTFTWTIEDFLNRPERINECIRSSTFTVTGPNEKVTTWELQLFPNGETEYDSNLVGLYLNNKKISQEKVSFTFSILDASHQKIFCREMSTKDYHELYDVDDEDKHLVGFYNIITHEDFEDRPHLLPNGNLTVVCDLTVYGPEATISGSKFPDEKLAPVDNCGKQMNEQIGKLFGDEKFSDVKITCGGKVFHCHRSILSVRSPVFEAMFQSDMMENISRTVDIKDIKPEVVMEMLHFIYNGGTSTETVMDEIGKDLLGAAEQYQLDLLKNKCEEKLCSSLDVNNSVELLVLADLHQASKLRRMALRLVARNMDTIVDTDVYKELIPRYPALALEITKALVQKAGIKRKRGNNE